MGSSKASYQRGRRGAIKAGTWKPGGKKEAISPELKKSLQVISRAAKKGIMDMRMAEGLAVSSENREKLYEAINEAYPAIKGFTVRNERTSAVDKNGQPDIRYYKLVQKLPDGSKFVSGWHSYPRLSNSEAERTAHIRLQMYGQNGQVRNRDGTVGQPFGYYGTRENYEAAIAKGWDIPPGIRQYWREQDRR